MDKKKSNSTTILVTGVKGFLGSHVFESLHEYNLISDVTKNGHIDLCDKKSVLKLKSADIVIHLAGKTPYHKISNHIFFEENLSSTINIAEYCVANNVKKLIYVSTYVYGKPNYQPIDENHHVNPHTAYTESKYIGERIFKFYCMKNNIDLIILRPFNIFGDFQKPGLLIPNLIDSIKNNRKIIITNKSSLRDYLYISDFVNLIKIIIDYDSEYDIFNVGSGQCYSFEAILKKIEGITKMKINVNYKKNDNEFIKEICADISKISKKVGWKPEISLERGLELLLKSS